MKTNACTNIYRVYMTAVATVYIAYQLKVFLNESLNNKIRLVSLLDAARFLYKDLFLW